MKLSESMRLVSKLAAAYPSARLGQDDELRETLEVYAQMLIDLEFVDAERAVVACIAECKFFPTVAEIRERVAVAAVAACPAELAWNEVLAAVRLHGIYATPQFENPCTAIAVSNVGWRAICNSETIGVERAHFVRAYNRALELAKNEHTTQALLKHVDQPRLSGLHDEPRRSGMPTTVAGALSRPGVPK